MVSAGKQLFGVGDLEATLGVYQLIEGNITNGGPVWKNIVDGIGERHLMRAADGGHWIITDGSATFIRSKWSDLLPMFVPTGDWMYRNHMSLEYEVEESISVVRDFDGKYGPSIDTRLEFLLILPKYYIK